MSDEHGRHIRRLLVSAELLSRLTSGTFRVVQNEVLDDVVVIGGAWDPERACCVIFIEHPSFDLIPDDGIVPITDPPRITRLTS